MPVLGLFMATTVYWLVFHMYCIYASLLTGYSSSVEKETVQARAETIVVKYLAKRWDGVVSYTIQNYIAFEDNSAKELIIFSHTNTYPHPPRTFTYSIRSRLFHSLPNDMLTEQARVVLRVLWSVYLLCRRHNQPNMSSGCAHNVSRPD